MKNIIRPGRKYTILRFTDKGFLDARSFLLTYISVKQDPTGPFGYVTTLVTAGDAHILKWDKFIKIRTQDQFVLWEGTHEVNTSIEVWRGMMDFKSGHSIMCKRWPAYDPRYLLRAKSEIKQQAIAEYLEPLEPERLIIYQTISEQQ